MRFKKTMREFYTRDMRRLPIAGLPPGEASPERETTRELSSLFLHLAFNGTAVAIVIMAVAAHFTYSSPLVEALERVNKKYSVDAAVRDRLERLPADFKHYMKGGS